MLVAPRPMSVSVRTRLAVAKARLHRRDMYGPAASAALARPYASFTCPRICCSPTTMESRLAATRNRCRIASTPIFEYRCSSASPVRSVKKRRAGSIPSDWT